MSNLPKLFRAPIWTLFKKDKRFNQITFLVAKALLQIGQIGPETITSSPSFSGIPGVLWIIGKFTTGSNVIMGCIGSCKIELGLVMVGVLGCKVSEGAIAGCKSEGVETEDSWFWTS